MKRLFIVLFVAAIALACGSSGAGSSPTRKPVITVTPIPGQVAESVIQPTASPEQPTATTVYGASLENLVPLGQPFETGSLTITVNETLRPADGIVAGGNMFNDEPKTGNEYIAVSLTFLCAKDPASQCNISPHFEAKVVTTAGNIIEASTVAGIEESLEYDYEMYGGASAKGILFFEVPIADGDIKLKYEPSFGFSKPIWFALR